MHIHDLDGCAPTPLAHYLKALGVLRLVAEQADPQARGWWEGERFRLATTLNPQALEDFLLRDYRPSAVVAPWNKGSGFFQANDPGVAPLEACVAPRFQAMRDGIRAARSAVDELAIADAAVRQIKERSKSKQMSRADREKMRKDEGYKKELAEAERRFKALKAELIPNVRAEWRGPHRDWMDAALVLDEEGTARFPALLGTGGNDGRLDFTNNFMQRLVELFDVTQPNAPPRLAATPWLQSSLWGGPAPGCLQDRAVGQFLPGSAGGANSVNGADGVSQLNPFDFVLMLEGSLVLTASAVKRLDVQAGVRAAAPFVASSSAAGYATAADSDESARGEQWLPLWSQPLAFAECRRLFAEGRAQIGHATARQPLDIAQAVARLGVARGITAFQRFGYIERNGQSKLAVPLSRFHVREAITPQLACLDDLGPWVTRVKRQAGEDTASLQFRQAVRALSDTFLEVTQRPRIAAAWQALLQAVARVEGAMRLGGGFRAQPAPRLRPAWVDAADDGSIEFRLALALALQHGRQGTHGGSTDHVRRHWLPLDPQRRQARFATTGDANNPRLDKRPEVVMQGRSGLADTIALVNRRLVEASGSGVRQLDLHAAPRAAARLPDIQAWLLGQVDADRTVMLACALMALDRQAWAEQTVHRPAVQTDDQWPDDAWLCIRLAHLPWPLPDGRSVRTDPAILRRLVAGDGAGAVHLALRRLAAAGIHPALRAGAPPGHLAPLWAAALAFPVSPRTAERMLARLHIQTPQEDFA